MAEGEQATFTATLSPTSVEVVTAVYRTIDGTAQAGSDYRATSGTLHFEPGQARQTISVEVLDDAMAEAEERFTMVLSDPVGATIADGTGEATITDDDEPPTVAIDDAPPVEEGETAELVVRLSAASAEVVTAAYRTVGGTAQAGSDYRATSGTLHFEPGQARQTISVEVFDDAMAEAEERFTMVLSDPWGRRSRTGPGRRRSRTTTSRPPSRSTTRRPSRRGRRRSSWCG